MPRKAQQQLLTANEQMQQPGAPLPAMRITYPGKPTITDSVLKMPGNLFVMLFNPTCEHCEEMAISMLRNLSLFDQSDIVMMAAPGMGPYLEYFENNTRVPKAYPKVRLGVDSAGFIAKTFNYNGLPQINVYSPDRRLIRTFNGIESIDSLKPYLH